MPFLRDDLRLTPAAVRKLSPADLPAPKRCPVMAVAGGNESGEFLRQNRLLRDRWGAKAVPVCEDIPGTNHLDVLHGTGRPGRPPARTGAATGPGLILRRRIVGPDRWTQFNA